MLKSAFLVSEVETYVTTGKPREVLIIPIKVNEEDLRKPEGSYHSFKYTLMKRMGKDMAHRIEIIDKKVDLDFYKGLCQQALANDGEYNVIQIEIIPTKIDIKEKKVDNDFSFGIVEFNEDILKEIVGNFLTE